MALLGPWIWPLGVLGVVLLADIVRAAAALGADPEGAGSSAAPHHTVLAWGVVAGLVGLVGTLLGLGRLSMGVRAAAGGERAELEGMLDLFWEGAFVALSPAAVGLSLLAFALVAWIVLQYAFLRRRG